MARTSQKKPAASKLAVASVETSVAQPPVVAAAEVDSLIRKAMGVVNALEVQVRLMSRRPDDMYPVFFDEHVVNVSLPYAAFDNAQLGLATRHALPDPALVRMIIDLVPPLDGKSLVEVGAYTGALGLVLRDILKPATTHLIEPCKAAAASLRITLKHAENAADIVMHEVVIGEAGQRMAIAAVKPERLSETTYVRRSDGPHDAVALDSLDLGAVQLLVLDYVASKIDAIRGAAQLIANHRPAICTDRSGRDDAEILTLLEPHGYTATGVGKNHTLFIPK